MPGPPRQTTPSPAIGKAIEFMRKRNLTTREAASEAGISDSTLRNFLARHPEVRATLKLRSRGHQREEDCASARAAEDYMEMEGTMEECAANEGVSQAAVSKWLMRRAGEE